MQIKNKLLLVIYILSLFFSIYVSLDYTGSKLLYFLFTIVSLFYLGYLLRKNSIFFDNFIGIFFWMGIWFNYSLKLKLKKLYPEGIEGLKYWFSDGVGNFDFSGHAHDKVIIICIIAFMSIISASFIREYLFKYEPETDHKSEIYFYKKHKIKIIFSYILILISISYLNFDQKIFQRGMISDGTNLLSLLFNFLFFIFFPSCICIIINYESKLSKSLKFSIFISIFESVINSVSILSRNSIFNPISNFFGLIRKNNFSNKFKNSIFIFYFLSIVISFLFVLIIVSNIRNEGPLKITNLKEDGKLIETSTKLSSEKNNILLGVSKILISRLIGIEGIMTVSSSDKLGFELLDKAIKEKYSNQQESFYDTFKNEIRKQQACKWSEKSLEKCKLNSISLMGIIAFLFYSGSYLFLFFSLLLICLFCAFIEIYSYKLSRNLIYASLISQVLAYRLWHFGYLPINSYKLIISIVLMTLLIFFYRFLLKKIYKFNKI
tara:strand:+ start:5031 stop:6503 length:1473 start_codon:yes stop_codon:yes gene_type:complete